MGIITPVGGIVGPRPTGAAFRTGVWKQPEVYERRVDGVWVTPTYPDLAPYATNVNGEILVGTYNPGKPSILGYGTKEAHGYIRPMVKYPNEGLALDDARFAYVFNKAVTLNENWRFDLRYYDEPAGANVFGKTVQSANCKRVMSGNSCLNMSEFSINFQINPGAGLDFFYFYHDEGTYCDLAGRDYSLTSSDGSYFLYVTTDATSASRFPFGSATYRGQDTVFRPGVGVVTVSVYSDTSDPNRPISMWLLPP